MKLISLLFITFAIVGITYGEDGCRISNITSANHMNMRDTSIVLRDVAYFQYDTRGRVVELSYAMFDTTMIHASYEGNKVTTRMRIWEGGHDTIKTVTFTLNGHGDVQSSQYNNLGGTNLYEYDKDEHVVRCTEELPQAHDIRKTIYEWEGGNKISERGYNGLGGLLHHTRYEYYDNIPFQKTALYAVKLGRDNRNMLKKVIEAESIITEYTYGFSKDGRVSTVEEKSESGIKVSNITYTCP